MPTFAGTPNPASYRIEYLWMGKVILGGEETSSESSEMMCGVSVLIFGVYTPPVTPRGVSMVVLASESLQMPRKTWVNQGGWTTRV